MERNNMIDLHAHVLPGIDDGPQTLPEAIALLQVMSGQGLSTVVTGAHAFDGRYNATRDAVLFATEAVNHSLHDQGVTLRVVPGMELFLGFDIMRAVKHGQVLGIADSRHLIVELPAREYPLYAERALFELLMAGYRPILNHPERNRGIQKDPEILYRLAESGVAAMVTASSLLGRFGATAEKLAREYVTEGAAALIVSDAHDLAGRSPQLPEGLAVARSLGKADQSAEEALLR
jgi:protein-tyrosine phosphatase